MKIYYEWKNKRLERKNQQTQQTQQNKEYKQNLEIIEKLEYYKKRLEFIFIMCMSILLIYLFNPYQKSLPLITTETKLLIFLFAFILIATANWGIFIKESPLFIEFQNIIGKSPTTAPVSASQTSSNTSYIL